MVAFMKPLDILLESDETNLGPASTFVDRDIMETMLNETFTEAESMEVSATETVSILTEKKTLKSPSKQGQHSLIYGLESRLRALFQSITQEETQVEFQNKKSYSYEELQGLENKKTYYSLFFIGSSPTPWILHLQRELAEGLAKLVVEKDSAGTSLSWRPPKEADSKTYLHIGHFLNHFFEGMLQQVSPSKMPKVRSSQHMLRLYPFSSPSPSEAFQTTSYTIQSHSVQGKLWLAIPDSSLPKSK